MQANLKNMQNGDKFWNMGPINVIMILLPSLQYIHSDGNIKTVSKTFVKVRILNWTPTFKYTANNVAVYETSKMRMMFVLSNRF